MKKIFSFVVGGALTILSVSVSHAEINSVDDDQVNELVSNLEETRSRIDQLDELNHHLIENQQSLKDKIQQIKKQEDLLDAQINTLEIQKRSLKQPTQKKMDEVQIVQSEIDRINTQITNIDLEIAQQDLVIQKKTQEEKELLLKISQGDSSYLNQSQPLDLNSLLKQRNELSQQVALEKQTIQQIEALPKLSVPKMDPSLDQMTSLKVQKEELKKQLLVLERDSRRQDQKSPEEIRLIKKLNYELNELSKRRLYFSRMYDSLQTQYQGKQKYKRDEIQENKMRDSIARLKKEAQLLKQEATTLRKEMVLLDKRKLKLEQMSR